MLRVLSPSVIVTVLAIACAPEAATEPVLGPQPAAPDADLPPPPATEPGPAGVSLRLVRTGEPLEAVPVAVHDPDGSVRALLETDADGRVSIADVPEGGIGLTVPHTVFDHKEGWATVLGIPDGSDLTWGRPEPAATIDVDAWFPPRFADADRYAMQVGCQQFTAYQPEHVGAFVIEETCLTGDDVDLNVVAFLNGEPLAYTTLSGVPVVDGRLEADFRGAEWSETFLEVPLVAYDAPETLLSVLHASAGPLHRGPAPFTATALLETEDDWDIVVPLVPASRMDSRFTLMSLSKAGEQRMVKVLRSDVVTEDTVVELDLRTEIPSLPFGLQGNEDLTTFAVASPSTFACGKPDAQRLTIRAQLDGASVQWDVLAPATSAAVWTRPVLPAELDAQWPVDELESVRAEVGLFGQDSSGFVDLIASRDPYLEADFPIAGDDDLACLVRLSDGV